MHLAGPTCSGKSAIAQDLLELEPSCVIINADSKQVYRQLFLLTDRPSPCPRHVLYGHVSVFGSQAYSVVCWLKECIESLELLWSVGKIPVVVGGTALYLHCLLNGGMALDTAKKTGGSFDDLLARIKDATSRKKVFCFCGQFQYRHC